MATSNPTIAHEITSEQESPRTSNIWTHTCSCGWRGKSASHRQVIVDAQGMHTFETIPTDPHTAQDMIEALTAPCEACGWRGVTIVASGPTTNRDGKTEPGYAAVRCTSCLHESPVYDLFNDHMRDNVIEPDAT